MSTSGGLPRTTAVLEVQRAAGLHPAACLVATLDGEPAGVAAVGEAAPGLPMGPDVVVPWFSMTKLTVALRAAMAWSDGVLGLDDPVVAWVPDAVERRATVRHLLTHTAGAHAADLAGRPLPDWDAEALRVATTPPPAGWRPGHAAAYSGRAGFHLLAEVVRRALGDGRPWGQVVRDDVLLPLGMADSHVGVDGEVADALAPRAAVLRGGAPARPAGRQAAPFLVPRPPDAAAGGLGPVGELPRLLTHLYLGPSPLLPATAAEAMTARHRSGLLDQTFGAVLDWGLGVIVDAKVHATGGRVVPYGFGAHASPRTFGHGGRETSGLLCDPEVGLTAALVCTGLPGDAAHSQRVHDAFTALYEDLGLA